MGTRPSGYCDAAFRDVETAFTELFDDTGSGPPEVGAAVAVVCDGRPVVDLWGGAADAAGRPWERDTIVCVFSCTKAMAALSAHRLADRGLLDYDARVARYWPEFAQGGKGDVTVRQLMSNQAGLPALRNPMPPGAVFDHRAVADALAVEEPFWEPGTAHGYHTLTYGNLVGEVVRRIDGRDLGTFFEAEVARPLGADFLIGVAPEHDRRVAELVRAPGAGPGPTVDPMTLTTLDPLLLEPPLANSRPWRAAQIAAANGHGNARALARIYGALAQGGAVDGVTLLSPSTIAVATEPQVRGPDRTIPDVVTEYALGFFTSGSDLARGYGPRAFGHGGAYGSLGLADPETGIGFGFVFNQCVDALSLGRAERLLDAVARALA
jgi:CubicO group peptidase (beta-lactamase class C family)